MLELNRFHGHPLTLINELLFNWGNFSEHCNVLTRENMRYWSDLGVLIHVKYMNLANIFTLGNLYANVIFFNVIYFLGFLQLYKVFYWLQPHKKWLFVFSIFFIPSVMFWCSGIHKDGWILAAVGFACYSMMRWYNQKGMLSLVALIASLLLLLVSRYFVFLCFFPPFLLWIFFKNARRRVILFTASYIILLLVFFSIGNFTSFEPLDIIVAKQHDFFFLRGYSDMQTPILDHKFSSFVANFPTAWNHIFLRPYLRINDPIKYQAAAIDSWFVFGLFVLSVLFIKRKNMRQIFFLMLLAFSLSMYLFIGYSIPNCGALVRYKSEFTVLLITSLFALSEIPFFQRWYVPVPTGFSTSE